MKAAIVTRPGELPVYGEFQEPVPGQGEFLINVQAAAMSNLVRGKASGQHYTATPKTAFVPGVDGVGSLQDGKQVYFFAPPAPFGTMAERVIVASRNCLAVPEGIHAAKAAVLANPGMSSVAALRYRAVLREGETVLINGATGTSGQLAVQIARRLGAGKIIVTGRNKAILEKLCHSDADGYIALSNDPVEVREAFIKLLEHTRIDVVLDYIWGQSMEALFAAIAAKVHDSQPLRVIQIGAMSGPAITIPASVLRATGLTLMGSGIGSVSFPDLLASIADVFRLEAETPLDISFEEIPLQEIAEHWNSRNTKRIVFSV